MKSIVKVLLTLIVVALLIASTYFLFFIYFDFNNSNQAPDEALALEPSDEEQGVDIFPQLQWNVTDPDNDDLTFDVYFGTENPPPLVVQNKTSPRFDPDKLVFETTYYWKIVAWDDDNLSSTSEIWEFTTRENLAPRIPTNPSPNDQQTGVSITSDLSWTGGDPDDDAVVYDVYFGTPTSMSIVSQNQSSTSYNPGILEYTTTYTWQIIAWDEQGMQSEGPVWEFTTKDEPEDPPEENSRPVFVEEATAGWCSNCPEVATALHELYAAGEIDFYYVSLVHDENDEAAQRLEDDYNVLGFPTTYIDGGYKVVVGAESSSFIEENILDAASRQTIDIQLSLESVWDNTSQTFETFVTIENKESMEYSGRLKVYLTEQVSSWYDYEGVPYSYALLDFVIDRDINVPAGETIVETKDEYDASDLDPANIKLIAVLFNDAAVDRDSNPDDPDDPRPFEAHFVDAVDASELVEGGNLPPQVGIVTPKQLRWHFRGTPIRYSSILGKTILIGKTTVEVYAADDDAITKVTFSVDGEELAEDTEAPYEFTFRKINRFKRLVKQYTFTVTAYDTQGKTTSTDLEVLAFFL